MPFEPMDVHNWNFALYCEQQRVSFAPLPPDFDVLGAADQSLPACVAQKLIEGLRILDSLDRSHEFWRGRNALPTVYKLDC